MRIMGSLAVAAVLAAGSLGAQASLVVVTAPVGWSCGTGTGGFEPGCTPDVERGTLNFTYELSTPDSDPDPLRGAFQGAITSFSMTVKQQTRPDLNFVLAGSGFIFTQSEFDFSMHLSVYVIDVSGALGAGSLNLGITGGRPYPESVVSG